jgi:hypothetical protein
MFRAYFDASGNRTKSVLTMAGFVSREKKWERFEDDWKALLPSTMTMFHMTDFVNSRKGWESWKGPQHSKRRAEFISSLAECIKKATNKGFAQSMRLSHYDQCDKDYRVTEHYGSLYGVLGMGCLGRLQKWATKKKIDRKNILCIFEDGDEGQGAFLKLARAEGFNAIPQGKADIRAFDACDLAAWKARAVVDDSWERQLQLRDPKAADRILSSLTLVEDIVSDAGEVGMLTADGLKRACLVLRIPKRK